MRDSPTSLSPEEQRRFELLEANLSADDPLLERRLRSARRNPLGKWAPPITVRPQRAGALLATTGALCVIVWLTSTLMLAFTGCLLLTSGLYLVAATTSRIRCNWRRSWWRRLP
jgi:hypothetical protein